VTGHPIGVKDLLGCLKTDSRGPYLRAVLILTIRELFIELDELDQDRLLEELCRRDVKGSSAGEP